MENLSFQVEALHIPKTLTWNIDPLPQNLKLTTAELMVWLQTLLRGLRLKQNAFPGPWAPPSYFLSFPTPTGIRVMATWKPSEKNFTMLRGPWRSEAPSPNQRVQQGPTFRNCSTKKPHWQLWRPLWAHQPLPPLLGKQKRHQMNLLCHLLQVLRRTILQRWDKCWSQKTILTSQGLPFLFHLLLTRPDHLQYFQRANTLSLLLLHPTQLPDLMMLCSHLHPLLAWMTCPTYLLHLQKVSWKSSLPTLHPHIPVERNRTVWEMTPLTWRHLRSPARSHYHRYDSPSFHAESFYLHFPVFSFYFEWKFIITTCHSVSFLDYFNANCILKPPQMFVLS